MKRLRRIPLPAVVAMLFIATTLTWVFFASFPFSTYWQAKDRYWLIAINEDGMTVTRIEPGMPTPAISFTMTNAAGTFTTTSAGGRAGWDRHGITLPFWALFLLPISLVGLSLWRELGRLLRERRGGCRACGYDLTGNRSGVCPECGTRIVGEATP
jgi:hypothetical protein